MVQPPSGIRLKHITRKLDRVIAALQAPNADPCAGIDDAFACNLAAVLDLKDLLSADASMIIEITCDIETAGDDSEYARIFLSAPDPPDALRLSTGGLQPAVPTSWEEWGRVEAVLRGAFGHWMDRVGNHRAALAALACYGPAVLATSWLDVLGLTQVGVGLGLAHSVFYPSFNAVAVATVRPAERGKLMALLQAAFQLGTSAGGLWGLLAARAGYPAVFRASALAVALAFLLFAASPESRAREGPPG